MENSKGKFCGSCGANMPEAAQFCPQCGAKAPKMPGQPMVQNDAAAQAEAPAGAAPVAPTATPATATPGESVGVSATATPVAPAIAPVGAPTAMPVEASVGAPPAPPTMPGVAPYVAPAPGQTGAASSFGGAGFAGFSDFATPGQTMPQADLGMNWHKFLIYFALFANALLSAITAIVLFTGSHYGDYASLVYLLFDGLRAFDIIFGLVYLALAAMAIYVRQQLAQFKRDAPRLLCALIVANGVVSLVHLWGTALFVSFTVSDIFTTIGTIMGCAIWIAGNVVYFKKRAHLFVN